MVSEIFDPTRWERVEGFAFEDITYHRATNQGTVRIAFDRPEVRNAFRPQTVDDIVNQSVGRALDMLGLHTKFVQRWKDDVGGAGDR